MLAGRLLETTDRPVESIAADAGFGSALSLRQHFHARYGIAPLAYRRQYRAAADSRRVRARPQAGTTTARRLAVATK
jgi:transcriptional regulator GlxA family with amidase domain